MTRTPADILNSIIRNLQMVDEVTTKAIADAHSRGFGNSPSNNMRYGAQKAYREAIALIRVEAQSILSPNEAK